jgi:hypothetical protein
MKKILLLLFVLPVAVVAQQDSRAQLASGHRLWDRRLANSAIAAFEAATRDRATAAEAWEALGRIYLFKGWQEEGVIPGWHDEPEFRDKAIAAFKASLAADPSRASAAEGLKQAEAFAASRTVVPPAPPRPEVKALDEKLDALRSDRSASPAAVLAAVEARAAEQADPTPFFTGAQILIDRGAVDEAVRLAERGRAASDRFIAENESAYKMSGKAQGARARGQATAIDLIGWAAFQRKDYTTAAARLEEAERLSRGQDFTNQFHLATFAQAQGDPERAREHYLNALSLAGGPAPLRQRATEALAALQANTASRAEFDKWLEEELARRREERRTALLRSVVDRPLPPLHLTALDGKALDVGSLRGKVLLLNFFSSW